MIQKRDFTLDIVRCLATLMLVIVHSMGPVNNYISTGLPDTGRIFLTAITSLFHPVPFFLMISGSLLLNKTESTKEFYSKRTVRVLVPFLFWSPIVFGLRYFVDGGNSFAEGIKEFIYEFFYIGAHNVYWFVYLILGIYLITPYLRLIINNATPKQTNFLVCILFGAVFMTTLFDKILWSKLFNSCALVYLFYYIYGYWIVRYSKNCSNILQTNLWIVFFVCWLLLVINEMLFNFNIPIKTIFVCVIFSLFAAYRDKISNYGNRFVNVICKYSYGIYLTHVIFIGMFSSLGLEKSLGLYFPIFTLFVVTPICIASLAILRWCMNRCHLYFNIY